MKRAKPKLQVKQSAPSASRRPLLVIDGDSFAHRAYHALPKNILRDGDRPAGAILGFANRLLQLYRAERPRAVLVGWDTLEAATYRHEAFADYQSGREFDDDLIEQLALIPKFVAACGFANAKRAGYEADDFLAAAAAAEERRGGTVLVAIATPFSSRQREPQSFIPCAPARDGADRARASARTLWHRAQAGAGLHRAGAAIRPTNCRAPRVSARPARRRCCATTAASLRSSRPGDLRFGWRG
jgi:hypothetical protein